MRTISLRSVSPARRSRRGVRHSLRAPRCAARSSNATPRSAPTRRSPHYERRGYLHLIQRRGLEDLEKSIADFTAALRFDASRALSLYGRGMARLFSGDAAGQNEMEAAIMMQANIAEEFKRYGAQ